VWNYFVVFSWSSFFCSSLTKEKNPERFRKDEKSLRTTDCADDMDKAWEGGQSSARRLIHKRRRARECAPYRDDGFRSIAFRLSQREGGAKK